MTSRLWIAGLISASLLTGCATRPSASNPDALAAYQQNDDPLEPMNRKLYAVNNALDTYALKPVAQGYAFVVPRVVRNHIGNILANLHTPVVFINDILEAKSRRAGDSLMRFVVNSTLGVGGIFDVATGMGWPAHEADFGITLALWGVGTGPFLYLPVLGPSDPRDAAGFGVGIVSDPFFWVGQGAIVTDLGYARTTLTIVNTRAELLKPISQIQFSALDPYATFRSLYRQHRDAAIQAARDDNRHTIPAWFPQASPAPQD
ncbi:MlaA family lipoprotein [Acidisoma cellulosilyticum]|uniref:MlaA family lipoprotein n=1 Tax=Acidisoma cellulosilyticum TaxID=2802395 RepID=UPI001D0BC249|nr:VacJ family lipoprotein [Acidisoma cellulosilyticum]